MSISVKCNGCGKTFTVKDEFAGKKGKCKSCGSVIAIPKPEVAQDTYDLAEDDIADVAAAGRAEIQKMAAQNVAAPVEAGSAELPTARLAPASKIAAPYYPPPIRPIQTDARGTGGGIRVNGLNILLVIIGVAMVGEGLRELRLGWQAKLTPQAITCSQLIHSGYGDNAYVHMTNFHMHLESFVRKGQPGNPFSYETVWVPCDPDNEKLASVQLIVKSSQVHNPKELKDLSNDSFIEGLIVNKIDSLNDKERAILQGHYGTFDVNNCLILEDQRTPKSAGIALVPLIGGLIVIAGALVWMFEGISHGGMKKAV